MKGSLQEQLKNRVLNEFVKEFFNSTGDPAKMLEMMLKKDMVDGVFKTDAYKEIDDNAANKLLKSENVIDEMYKLYMEFM